MFRILLIVFGLFFVTCVKGDVKPSISSPQSEKNFKGKKNTGVSFQTLKHPDANFYKSKRKSKAKGTEVSFAPISQITDKNPFSYKAFLSKIIINNYASFLHCVDRKRGPPTV